MAGLDLTIPNLKLNDGNSMPMIGYGTGTAWFKKGDESQHDPAIVGGVKVRQLCPDMNVSILTIW